ncbi:MAG TPA: tRNA (guanosine(46)-N7)-methyltransferase TrmB [Candidatus Limnocylindria bacterium]|nr:tRNA (guanosine(46)-N7)-methyltransferase TrmB [Candidatus Limnocylindria bacterium]
MSHPLWRSVFGNARPVEIEIGPGRGDVIIAFARAYPGVNFFGVEAQRWYAARAQARAERLGLANVRVIAADARCVLRHLVPDASVHAVHVYFPDPWPKKRHGKRRLFSPAFAEELRRVLVTGGVVYVATDLADVFALMRNSLLSAGFTPDRAVPARTRPVTRFEEKYAASGTFQGAFRAPLVRAARSPQPAS